MFSTQLKFEKPDDFFILVRLQTIIFSTTLMKKYFLFIIILLFIVKTFAQTSVAVGIDRSLTETPVLLKTLSGSISGSLVMPGNALGKIPVVLIIGDAGATDRNGNNPKATLTANTYKLLANDLGKNGIATLRYDKRLVGESISSIRESQLKIDDYSDDAVGLINMLNDDQRFSKIIVLGHGEGSLVAMIAMTGEPVKGFISAEGAADPAEKLLNDQMKLRPKFLYDEFRTIMDSLKKGKMTPNVDPSLYYIARPSIQPFLMSWCRCVPLKGMKRIKIPVLIIHGTTDLAIPVDNAEKFRKVKSDANYLIVNDMNHQLKEAPADPAKNMETYSNPGLPLKPEVIPAIVDFIKKLK